MFYFRCYSKSKVCSRTCFKYLQQFSTHSNSKHSKLLPQDSSVSTSLPENYVKQKFDELVKWYEQVTGMDEVRLMQNRVIEAQDRFIAAQDKRRSMSKELNVIQTKLKEIYSELYATSRGEERYLQLITQEHAILKEERRINSEFALVEREERDSFMTLSACVKESHEKERAQAERTKYWSIIGSIIGTVIGIAGSSLNNEFKMKELRKLVKDLTLRDTIKSKDEVATVLENHEKKLASVVNEMRNTVASYRHSNESENVMGQIDKLLHTISSNNQSYPMTQKSVQHLEKKVDYLVDMVTSSRRYNGQIVAIPNDLETLIKKQTQDMRIALVVCATIGVIVPCLFTFLSK